MGMHQRESKRTYSLRVLSPFACIALGFVALLPSTVHAQLIHRYSFTSDASDSVGTAHGTVVDAGTTTNFAFTGGQIDLSANAGEGSDGITEDAYVDLPNGILSGAFGSGDTGEVTIETWVTASEVRTWQRVFEFSRGNNETGEDAADTGTNHNHIWAAFNSGRHADGVLFANYSVTGGGTELDPAIQENLALNTEHHLVATMNVNDTSAGPDGTSNFYVNGSLLGTFPIVNGLSTAIQGGTYEDLNNWLGRSQWNDPVFDGSYNEFRIYDEAAGPNYVARSFNAGPDTVDPNFQELFDLTLHVNTSTGNVVVENTSFLNQPVTFNYLVTESEGGALNPSGWDSLADQGLGVLGDVDNSGTVDSGDLDLAEASFGTFSDGDSDGVNDGDTDGDGDSDGADMLNMFRSIGKSSGGVEGFIEAGGIGSNTLAELNLKGSFTLGPGETHDLGVMYDTTAGGVQDLDFKFGRLGSAVLENGDVQYSSVSVGSVPEPTTAFLLVSALAMAACRRASTAR